MKNKRQQTIAELIQTEHFETQEDLAARLNKMGFDVTQATISRDIKELQLIKSQDKNGVTRYVTNTSDNRPISERFLRIFKETTLSYAPAQNLIVVRTLSGCSNAAAEAIDCLELEHIVGSIAGDNTLLVIVDNEKNVPAIIEAFDRVINE